MNGRIYDPTLGRMLQADPFIQAPKNSQNYNRYAYVINNPLSYTDPTGYNFFKSLVKFDGFLAGSMSGGIVGGAIQSSINHNIHKWVANSQGLTTTAGVVIGAFTSWWCGPCSIGFTSLFSSNMAAYNGASSSQAFHAGGRTAATAGVFYGIGQAFNANSGFWETGGAGHIAAHAIAGGVIADLQGGNFGHGFFSAGVTKYAGSRFLPSGNLGAGEIAYGTVVSAIIGGTASSISGGKFANGARTAAMQYLFNQANEALQEGGYANPLGENFDGAVKVKVGGKWMYVPRDRVADIKLAEATNTSVGEYTRTTPEEYAKGLGYVGGTLATIGSGGVAYFGWAVLGGAAWLDPSPQNVIGALAGPFSKMMGPLDEVFYPGSQTLEQTINTIGHINDGITVACDIPLRCN